MKLVTGALLLALGSAAHAQSASRIPEDEWRDARSEDSTEVRKIAQRYGNCVVRKKAAAAREFVLYQPIGEDGDRRRRALVNKVSDGDCLYESSRGFGNVRMTFPGDNMRYAMAEALFRRELNAAPPLGSLEQVAPLMHPVLDEAAFQPKPGKRLKPKEAAELHVGRQKEQARIALSRFGECVVRTDPAAVQALLRTAVVTPEESAAFAALREALATCVAPGQTIKLNKALVRGAVAYNYYRLARAPRSPQPVLPAGGKN